MPDSQDHRLSIVIPVLNEQDNVAALSRRLAEVLLPLGMDYEILFVDDGSTDETPKRVAELHRQDRRICLLVLARNFGHQFALSAGIDHARGDAVVLMDGDFQHPPELIPEMVSRWRDGYEVVHTVRKDTADATFLKRLTSRAYYYLFQKLTGIRELNNAADFRLLDRKAVLALRRCRERARFLRGLTFWIGFRSCMLEFSAPPRRSGRTKFNVRRMFRLAADGILSFSAAPLYLSLYSGLAMFLFGLGYGAYALWIRFVTDRSIAGWASTIIVISLFGGFQTFLLGMQGLYVGKIFEEMKKRPLYLLSGAVGVEIHDFD